MEPIGTVLAVRHAAKALGEDAGLEAVGVFMPEGGLARQILADGVKIGTAVLPGPALARRAVRLAARAVRNSTGRSGPIPLPKSFYLVLLRDKLVVRRTKAGGRVGAAMVEFARGSYEVRDVREGSATMKLTLVTPQGLVLRMETKRLAVDKVNPDVVRAIAAAGRAGGDG